ncbi:MAG: hypothetical protein ABR600_04635 [Actinomycetota bacterium]
MKRRAGILVLLGLVTGSLALAGAMPGARAATQPPQQVLVPNTTYAVQGDTKHPGPALLGGPSSTYASFGGQANRVDILADNGGIYGHFSFIIENQGTEARRLNLRITAPSPVSYTCVTGPEDPNRASNKNNPRLGAEVSITGGKAQLLCYDSTGTQGYMVYTPNVCVAITDVGPSTVPGTTRHYVADGRGCKAEVYKLNKNRLTEVPSSGPGGLYDFPIYFEGDA